MGPIIVSLTLGVLFYAVGAASVNLLISPLERPLFFSTAVELAVLSAAVYFLSALYYGKLSPFMLFISGIIIGSKLTSNPVYVGAALLPLLMALKAGTGMGNSALMDLKGKLNFYDNSTQYLVQGIVIVLIALLIGHFLGQMNVLSLIPKEFIDMPGKIMGN